MNKTLFLVFSLLCVASWSFSMGFPEYYYKISSNAKQKQEFVKILKPLIKKSNENILKERAFVQNFFNQALQSAFRNTPPSQLHYLRSLAKKYRVKNLFDKKEFLKRVDTIPMALALTQGAIESGWGKSRFVRQANNLFGHWTWGEVGLIPAQRDEGKSHKIRIFSSLQASVNAYTLNLNRNTAYKDFRNMRYKKHSKGEKLSSFDAAESMLYYSQMREKYVKMLQKMMKDNNLLRHDRKAFYKPASLMASAW